MMQYRVDMVMQELKQRDQGMAEMSGVHHRQRHQITSIEQRLLDQRVELPNAIRDNKAVVQ